MKNFMTTVLLIFIDLGHARDLGKIVALVTEPASQVILSGGYQLLGIDLLRLHDQKRLRSSSGNTRSPLKPTSLTVNLVTLGDVRRDVDLFLVRRDRYLSRVNIELQITAIQIIGRQRFQIGRQLFFGIFVVAGKKRKPAAGLELEQIDQILVRENIVLPTTLIC